MEFYLQPEGSKKHDTCDLSQLSSDATSYCSVAIAERVIVSVQMEESCKGPIAVLLL